MRIIVGLLIVIGALFLSCSECDTPTNNTAPSVSIVTPASGDVPIGVVDIKAVITDDDSITTTSLFIDQVEIGSHSSVVSDTFFFSWDASNEDHGSERILEVCATDGNSHTSSDAVTITLVLGSGDGTIHDTDITSDETWSLAGSPHIINYWLDIENGATVTIEAGSVVKFNSGYDLTFNVGSLIANGTSAAPISFTSSSDSPASGDWEGIEFKGYNSYGNFEYCTISYGGGMALPVIKVTDSAIVNIKNSTIRDCGMGMLFEHEARIGLDFNNNTFARINNYPIFMNADYVHRIGNANIFTDNLNDTILVDGGNVVGTVTWKKLDIPYLIFSPVYCGTSEQSGVLIIEPGVSFAMSTNGQFVIGAHSRGGFIADGTSAQISFNGNNLMPGQGEWNNIYFYPNADDDSCIIRSCKIERGGIYGDGNIKIKDAMPTIVDDSIGHSAGYGIYLDGDTPDPQILEGNNTFYNNFLGPVNDPD